MLKRLFALANQLDEAEHPTQGSLITRIVKEAQLVPELVVPEALAPDPAPVSEEAHAQYKEKATKMRENGLFDEIMHKVTGLRPATINYYLEVMPEISKLRSQLDATEKMEPGSLSQIQAKRKIIDTYNNYFDPYNSSPVPAMIVFVSEIGKVAEVVRKYLPQFNKPEFGEDTVIDNFTTQLKDKGFLGDLNKAKRQL